MLTKLFPLLILVAMAAQAADIKAAKAAYDQSCKSCHGPDGTPNAATLHSGEPVTSGHKIIITKWFRELGSGPMFYED